MDRDYGVAPPRYRLPDATRVGRVRLQVSDVERSLAYYQEVIGLRVLERDGSIARLGPLDDRTVLVELHERPGARAVPPHGRYGLYHFAICVPSRSDLGRFVAHLAHADVRVASADHLVSEAIYLWDPDGLGIEVYADRPRDDWRTRGAEVAMATEPLDLRGLIRAARVQSPFGVDSESVQSAEPAWEGLPPGTVMGHVHLHVGDLARAEALYHAALGFDKMVWSFPGALFLAAGGYHHHLGTNTWVEGAGSPAEGDAQLLEWTLILPEARDIAAAAESVAAAGHAVAADDGDRVVSDAWGSSVRLTTAG